MEKVAKLRGKECERKEGREGGKEGTRVRLQDKQRDRGEWRKGGEGDEVCLVLCQPVAYWLSVRPLTASTGRPVLLTSSPVL